MLLAQLTDTHVVREGSLYFGIATERYLADAIAAVNALRPLPDAAVVTGDLTNFGKPAEYERFVALMQTLRVPYYVIPGNHDDRDAMRARLAPETFGGSRERRVRYAVDVAGVRLIGLDGTGHERWPGGSLDRASLAWLETTLASDRTTPTIVCVHQPPFRTGMHYMDAMGYPGARRFARIVAAHPNVGRILSGHIHCVRSARIGRALALSAPSTAPQIVPELFERRAFAMRHETPGFALHAFDAATGFRSTIVRRDANGRYAPVAGPGDSGANDAA